MFAPPVQRVSQALVTFRGKNAGGKIGLNLGCDEVQVCQRSVLLPSRICEIAKACGRDAARAEPLETEKERCRYTGVTNSGLARNMLSGTQVPPGGSWPDGKRVPEQCRAGTLSFEIAHQREVG